MLFTVASVVPQIDLPRFIFHSVATGVIYPIVDVKRGVKLELGKRVPVTGMFELFELVHKDQCFGYLFKSSFAMEIKGGYLVTFLKGKGIAESHKVVLKLDHLIIYDFPNRGTLATSPALAEDIKGILEAQ